MSTALAPQAPTISRRSTSGARRRGGAVHRMVGYRERLGGTRARTSGRRIRVSRCMRHVQTVWDGDGGAQFILVSRKALVFRTRVGHGAEVAVEVSGSGRYACG